MSESVMSAGDFCHKCGELANRSFIYSSSDQQSDTQPDLRIRFTEISATLCPNRVLFRNEYGESMTVRNVKRVHMKHNVMPGIDRFTLVSDTVPESTCIIFSVKISKTH